MFTKATIFSYFLHCNFSTMVSLSHNSISMLFFLLFTANLWLCLVPSTAELQRFEHPVKVEESLSFLVVGDWGRKGLYNQSAVAIQVIQCSSFLFLLYTSYINNSCCLICFSNYNISCQQHTKIRVYANT